MWVCLELVPLVARCLLTQSELESYAEASPKEIQAVIAVVHDALENGFPSGDSEGPCVVFTMPDLEEVREVEAQLREERNRAKSSRCLCM